MDPFYPGDWSGAGKVEIEGADACIAHPSPTGNLYHYHILTPCLIDSTIDGTKKCSDIPECNYDPATYSISSYESHKTKTILGIARDGHVIYGPYVEDNTLFDCTKQD